MMKISNSKQQLARIISENGGWRNGEFAAQDGDGGIGGYKVKPEWDSLAKYWWRESLGRWFFANKIKNHHHTVLSRAEYFHLYQSPDADGWIEWKGGECPVGEGDRIDVKFSDGDTLFGVNNGWNWGNNAGCCNIIAYRLHKPERVETVEYNYSGVVYTGPVKSEFVVDKKPTLDQLLQDWRNAGEFAKRKQAEADEAAAMRDERWNAVQARAGEVGVTVGACDSVASEHKLEITGWRDLQLNDIIEYVDGDIKDKIGMTGPVVEFAPDATDGMMVRMKCDNGPRKGRLGWPMKWRFIRRP